MRDSFPAEFYLNMNRTEENEPYHEAHSNVAVMFASLTDLSIDESNILIDLNEIICEFDKLLFEPYFVCRIEKIKIAGENVRTRILVRFAKGKIHGYMGLR